MRIWLHIGLRKTGTTAMQNWCLNNADHLRRNGLAYLRPSNRHPTCGQLARALARSSAEVPMMLNALKAGLHSDLSDVLISSEDFADMSPLRMRPLIKAFDGHTVTVLVWLRRQDRLAEALYKQIVKWNGCGALPLTDFLRSRHLSALDYERLLARWREALPDVTLRPQIYEEATAEFQPDSILALLQAIGREDLYSQDCADLRENITPAGHLVQRYALIPANEARALRRANRRLMGQLGAAAAGHGDIFAPDETAALIERFSASNEAVRGAWFPERMTLFAPQATTRNPRAEAGDDLQRAFERLFQEERARL